MKKLSVVCALLLVCLFASTVFSQTEKKPETYTLRDGIVGTVTMSTQEVLELSFSKPALKKGEAVYVLINAKTGERVIGPDYEVISHFLRADFQGIMIVVSHNTLTARFAKLKASEKKRRNIMPIMLWMYQEIIDIAT